MPSYNKVVLGNGTVVIDLTNDTVVANKLLYGYSAHAANGDVISGTLFEDYPDTETIIDDIQDSSNRKLTDSLSTNYNSGIVYVNKATL